MKKFLFLAPLLALSLSLASCTTTEAPSYTDNEETNSSEINNENNMNNGNGSQVSFEVASQDDSMRLAPQSGDTIATLKTSMGDIKVLLYTDKAPITTKNFIELAKQGKYENVPFHRVIKDFMIQCGDFENKNGTGGYSFEGPGTKIADEFGAGLKHIKGALSMANAGPNTGGSQFFIVQSKDGTDWLNGKHAIFGYAYEGLDVVDKIGNVETLPGDKPVKEVLLLNVEISTQK